MVGFIFELIRPVLPSCKMTILLSLAFRQSFVNNNSSLIVEILTHSLHMMPYGGKHF